MKIQPDESACVYGAGVILNNLKALMDEMEGVRAARDIECIHRMRVASRRLRTALPLFRRCTGKKKVQGWEKKIHNITSALGAARDCDVQIELLEKTAKSLPDKAFSSGISRLRLRLKQQRQGYQSDISRALDDLQKKSILESMLQELGGLAKKQGQVYLYTPSLYFLSFSALSRCLNDMLAFDEFVFQPHCITELHAMRISAKQLRYTIEIFAPLYAGELKVFLQTSRKIQESLGSIHDNDVWIQFLPFFLEEEQKRCIVYLGSDRQVRRLVPGIQYFLGTRQKERDDIYRSFVTDWQQWKDQEFWESLRQTIQVPFFKAVESLPAEPEALPSNPTQMTNGK